MYLLIETLSNNNSRRQNNAHARRTGKHTRVEEKTPMVLETTVAEINRYF
jgi:hypothetical protein